MNGIDREGKTKTFGAGSSRTLNGRGGQSAGETGAFKPIGVPDGTYMTQITCQGTKVFAIDQDHNLWLWGEGIR